MKPEIVKAIRIIWDSLDSHLDHTLEDEKCSNKNCGFRESAGDKAFHKKTSTEYAEIILTLTKLL